MKNTMKFLKITTFSVAIAAGLIFTFTKCRKDIVVVPVPIHDTLFGKAISGVAQYLDFNGNTLLAKGAVVTLYSGTTKSGNPVASAFADSTGAYSFPYLLPGNYFVWATFNTKNNNNPKAPIIGINFETVPGYAITMASSNISQNIMMANAAPSGNLVISITASDTTGSNGAIKTAPFESHSKCDWWTEYKYDGGIGGTTLAGGFNVFKVTKFYFDEANPANSTLEAYVLLSSINTFEPARDKISGCVPKSLHIDTFMVGSDAFVLVPGADTAWFKIPVGSIEKYGKGYLGHGIMEAFYKHDGTEIIPPRISPVPPDTNSFDGNPPYYNGPFGQRVSNDIDLYFEYQGKNKVVSGSNFNWFLIFEAEFSFTREQYFWNNTSLGNTIHVTPHVQLKGANNVEI